MYKGATASLTLLFISLLAGCGGGAVAAMQQATAGGAPAPFGIVGNTLCLNADGPGGQETYQRIESVFGAGAVESPSDKVYTPARPHILEREGDGMVGPHFAILAIDPTDVNLDGVPWSQGGDRSRTEIKIAPGTGGMHDAFKAHEGDTYVYTWRFRIAPDMKFSPTLFTHIHQIKAYGGEFSDPALITLTISNGKLTVRHIGDNTLDSSGFATLGTVLLSGMPGNWIDVREEITYSNTLGRYQLTMRNPDGSERLKVDAGNLSLWRTGASHMTPKWGIYRRHDVALNQNVDDYLYLANLAITRGSVPASACR